MRNTFKLIDTRYVSGYKKDMIQTFRHKGLEQLYRKGIIKGVRADHVKCLRIILARLNASQHPEDMNLPGLKLHSLKGSKDGYWAVSVSGAWRLIFRFENHQVVDVDYQNYH